MKAKEFARHIFEQVKSNWYIPVTEHQRATVGSAIKIGTFSDSDGVKHDWYRKTISGLLNNSTGSATQLVGDVITSDDTCTLVNLIISDSYIRLPHNYFDTSNHLNAWINGNDLYARFTSQYSGKPYTAIIEYYTSEASTDQGGFEPLHEWSTEEKLVGYWIDGKAVYEKTVSFGALPNATTKSVNHGISGIETVVSMNAVAENSAGTRIMIPLVGTSGNVLTGQAYMNVDSTNVNINAGVDRTPFTKCYVTLRYTKTT